MEHKITHSETWPKRFLVFTIDHVNGITVRTDIIVARQEEGYTSAQDFAEKWFQDHAVLRIYELHQMYAIGKFRGQ